MQFFVHLDTLIPLILSEDEVPNQKETRGKQKRSTNTSSHVSEALILIFMFPFSCLNLFSYFS